MTGRILFKTVKLYAGIMFFILLSAAALTTLFGSGVFVFVLLTSLSFGLGWSFLSIFGVTFGVIFLLMVAFVYLSIFEPKSRTTYTRTDSMPGGVPARRREEKYKKEKREREEREILERNEEAAARDERAAAYDRIVDSSQHRCWWCRCTTPGMVGQCTC